MEDMMSTVDQSVKERLLVAGLREIEEHGFNDFSLRRVASSCNLSCAAPYRHFKSKEELLVEIFRYINSRWQKLRAAIDNAFPSTERRVIELSVAYLRFLIVTPSYMSMMFQKSQFLSELAPTDLPEPDSFLTEIIELYGKENGWSDEAINDTVYNIRSMLYGTALLIRNCKKGEESRLVDGFRHNLAQKIAKN